MQLKIVKSVQSYSRQVIWVGTFAAKVLYNPDPHGGALIYYIDGLYWAVSSVDGVIRLAITHDVPPGNRESGMGHDVDLLDAGAGPTFYSDVWAIIKAFNEEL